MPKKKSAKAKEFSLETHKIKIGGARIEVGETHKGFMEQVTRNITKRDSHRENGRNPRANDHETAAASLMWIAVSRAVRENEWSVQDKGGFKGLMDRRRAKRSGTSIREKEINQVIRRKLKGMQGKKAHEIFVGIMEELLDTGIIRNNVM